MPIFDLRHDSQQLCPLAPFKVLAVMTHPADRVEREQMLALIQSQTGEGHPRRGPLSDPEFRDQVSLAAGRAMVAGALLLTRIQLHENNEQSSLNRAIPLVTELLPLFDGWARQHWSPNSHIGHRPRSRRKMLESHTQFRSVAHLWAAMIHGLQQKRQDIWPGSNRTLPTFLAYADCMLALASRLPLQKTGRPASNVKAAAWRFTIPESLRHPAVRIESLPLNEEQRRVLQRSAFS